MDYNDLWEVTTVSSATSQATFSCTKVPSTRTSSTISERENKRDLFPFDRNEKEKTYTYRNAEESKTTSLSFICQKLNHDLHRSFKLGKPISASCGNKKESHDQTKDNINKEDIHISQIYEDMNNASTAPFIELGAVYKILDFILDSDSGSKVPLLTNNCYNEILQTLRCLLIQRHKKLEDLLSNDSSLHRCEHCGVISCMLGSYPTIKNVKSKRTKTRHNDEATAERDCVNDQNNEKSEILINPPNLVNNMESKINNCKANNRTEYKDKLSEMELLPTKERAFVMKRYIESSNETNNISVTNASINASIKNKLYPDNNTIKKLFTDLEMKKKNKKYECNSAGKGERNNPGKSESSNAIETYASIDEEKVVRKISYEPKSQIDDFMARDRRSDITQKIQVSQQLDKHGDTYPIVDTVKYLARGQFIELNKKENELLSKLQERHYNSSDEKDARNGQSSILYGSREDYSQRDVGFWLFDESGHLPEIALQEYHYRPMRRIDNNRENVSFSANVSRYSRTVEKVKTDRSNYMEKDSLENCALLEQRRESDVTIFSSSSTENLMYGSLDRKYKINNTDDEDIPRGRKLVLSRPSLDIARHVRAQIAKDGHNAKESISELYTHDSNILVRLSPKTRRKICRLINTIVSSDKDSIFFHNKYLINNVLNSEKLLHSKSADAAFANSNKTNNELINICADDCIPTRLSDSSEGKDCLLKSQNNFVSICNQDLNKSKNSVKIHENMTSVSADNSTKKIRRQIIYKDAFLKNVGNNGYTAEILPIYRKILENSGDMDWESFQKFVEVLHPGEKKLWRDVCRIISEEARRSNDTEICIEISPINPEEVLKTGEVMTCAREIVFELDMTLKDVENFFNKRFVEERLDIHKNAEGVTS